MSEPEVILSPQDLEVMQKLQILREENAILRAELAACERIFLSVCKKHETLKKILNER